MAEALYRKYRPQVFGDVVGQDHIERTIKNAIAADKLSHAYLFTGPRGTGKTTTARLLAKALLCERGTTPEPDGTCQDCRMIAEGTHPDVYELDAASRTGVENVREEIIGRVQFAPTRGRYKVYIIDEVHMLSPAAFNALLKTLEEPPSHVVFILATTDPQKIPETIHSRCQRFDFRRIGLDAIVARLGAVCTAEGVEFEGEALELVAHRAEGGLRNALTALEQLIAFGEGKVTVEAAERMLGSLDSSDLATIVRHIGQRDVAACFRWVADYVETGADLAQFAHDLAEHVRNLYVLALAGSDVALEVSESVRRELVEELPLFGQERLARLLAVLGDVLAELRTSTNPRLTFEIALTRMVRPDSDLTLAALAERVEALEAGHSAVAHVVSAPGATMLGATDAAPAMSTTAAASAPVEARPAAAEPAAVSAAAPRESATYVKEPAREMSGTAQAAQAQAQAQATSAQSEAAASQPAASAQSAAPSAVPAELAASLQNPASLQRMWQAAMATLKKNKAAYGVLFMNTKAIWKPENAAIIVDFAPENSFAFKAVQKPEVQEAVEEAFAQACGTKLPFSYTQGAANSSAVTATSSAGEKRATESVSREFAPQTHANAQAQAQAHVQASQTASAEKAAPGVSHYEPQAVEVPEYEPVPYDEVPLDAYGYAEEPMSSAQPTPSAEPARREPASAEPARAATAASVSAAATSATSLPAEPPIDTTTCATPETDEHGNILQGAQSADDLAALLAAGGFGADVTVEEVQ